VTTSRTAPGPAIEALLASVPPSDEQIDRFLESHSFPVVEGERCTFVYHGDAIDVRLRHWVYGLPNDLPFERIPGTDLWYRALELSEGARVEYKLEVTEGEGTRLIEDPLNPLRAEDPFGANSVCRAFGYEVPAWALPDPDVAAGTLEDRVFRSRSLAGSRNITLYRPAGFEQGRPYPILAVHDGGDYLRYAGLKTVLDNLIHGGEVAPLVAVLMHPPDRMAQYRDSGPHAVYLAEELIPWLERDLSLGGAPQARGLMGASLGAVASLSTAIRYPGTFGRLLLQSGSFAHGKVDARAEIGPFLPIVEMVNRFREEPLYVSERVFVSCGLHESLIEENRALIPVLEGTGMSVRYVEARDGHNWENWRDRLGVALPFLFPGPRAPVHLGDIHA